MGDSKLKFLAFESIIEPSFWHKLCQIKLDKDMLEEKFTNLIGSFLNSVLMSVHVDYTSFEELSSNLNDSISLEKLCRVPTKFSSPLAKLLGQLFNFNTLQGFKNCDKTSLIKTKGIEIRKLIESGAALKNPSVLNQFFLITFADLKSYDFYYWFCFPTLSSLSFNIIKTPLLLKDAFKENEIESLLLSHKDLPQEHKLMFCVEFDEGTFTCKSIEHFINNTDTEKHHHLYICFVDPSTENFCPGWPLRNLLALITFNRKVDLPLNVISLRIGIKFNTSFVVKINIEGDIQEEKWVGWEKNARNKFGPRTVNLRNNIDPLRLADSSVDLNLKLMKWRLVKDINLEIIKSQKCLLLGAGTLGCAVARCLMGWGIRHITFVDNGTVSFSNPVRQSLYTYEDCDLGKGAKYKAYAAADALKKIFPSMMSQGIIMDIPMPDHVVGNLETVSELHKLIKEHDVVFLLTDSRESRWLPTVIASVLNKLAITVALGFDSYLAMRHGIESENNIKLGCYFCNDVTAPGNSKNDRTLDQQCTVTRPGVSYIASSVAVELFVSILQHSEKRGSVGANDESILGIIPHSIRGFLSQFTQIMPSTISFSQCVACSQKVKEEYLKNNQEFLKNVFESSAYLEKLMGLDELHKLSEMAEILELSDDDDDDDDDNAPT